MTKPVAFAFDLDDTLYLERDYVSSCFAWVAAALGRPSAKDALETSFDKGERDPIGVLCRQVGIGDHDKQKMIEDMRAHAPTISLLPDAAVLLSQIRERGLAFSIVTNGRSVTQRCKIKALSLTDATVIAVSEEVGAAKPDEAIYRPVIEAFPGARCVYVGDNPSKDFATPNRLGWLSVMRLHNGRGIHAQSIETPAEWRPQRTVAALDELADLISGVASDR